MDSVSAEACALLGDEPCHSQGDKAHIVGDPGDAPPVPVGVHPGEERLPQGWEMRPAASVPGDTGLGGSRAASLEGPLFLEDPSSSRTFPDPDGGCGGGSSWWGTSASMTVHPRPKDKTRRASRS
ncbi:uncharacterized protein LOC144337272 [Macaca mulatta]